MHVAAPVMNCEALFFGRKRFSKKPNDVVLSRDPRHCAQDTPSKTSGDMAAESGIRVNPGHSFKVGESFAIVSCLGE
jgi:hypothetical protein